MLHLCYSLLKKDKHEYYEVVSSTKQWNSPSYVHQLSNLGAPHCRMMCCCKQNHMRFQKIPTGKVLHSYQQSPCLIGNQRTKWPCFKNIWRFPEIGVLIHILMGFSLINQPASWGYPPFSLLEPFHETQHPSSTDNQKSNGLSQDTGARETSWGCRHFHLWSQVPNCEEKNNSDIHGQHRKSQKKEVPAISGNVTVSWLVCWLVVVVIVDGFQKTNLWRYH